MSVDPLANMYPSLSPYAYVANNPLNNIDPDGRTIVPVHGTWSSNEKAWKNLGAIQGASNKLFGDNIRGASYEWSGGNYASMRTEAALGLIDHVRTEMQSESFNGEITLVGHSHGGNVSIEALNMMAEMEEFDGVGLNLLTINTPVREDYQLSESAAGRVNHANVYDPKDPVQSRGGSIESSGSGMGIMPESPSNKKFHGEYGPAGRTFNGARNIRVSNPQGVMKMTGFGPRAGDFHNSHNRVNDWINNNPDQK